MTDKYVPLPKGVTIHPNRIVFNGVTITDQQEAQQLIEAVKAALQFFPPQPKEGEKDG